MKERQLAYFYSREPARKYLDAMVNAPPPLGKPAAKHFAKELLSIRV
jgi:hypothetical protein